MSNDEFVVDLMPEDNAEIITSTTRKKTKSRFIK